MVEPPSGSVTRDGVGIEQTAGGARKARAGGVDVAFGKPLMDTLIVSADQDRLHGPVEGTGMQQRQGAGRLEPLRPVVSCCLT